MYKKKKNKARKFIACLSILGTIILNLTPFFGGVHTAKALSTEDWMMEQYRAAGSPSTSTSTSTTSSTGGYYNSTDTGGAGLSSVNSQDGPSAVVAFTSDSYITAGVKVTATATPSGFYGISDPATLYFTWYIKRSDCDLTDSPSDSVKTECDEDGDGKITVNDWKIVAAKRVVKGDYDNSSANYGGTNAGGGVKADPSVKDWAKTLDPKKDNDVTAPDCYVQEPTSGIIYELRKTTPKFFPCPGNYHPACMHDSTASCNVLNPSSTYRADPVANVLTRSVENTFPACSVDTEDASDFGKIANCTVPSGNDDAALKNFEAYTTCSGEGKTDDIPLCVADSGFTNLYKTGSSSYVLGTIFGSGVIGSASSNETNGVCKTLAFPNNYSTSATPTYAPQDNAGKTKDSVPAGTPPYTPNFLENTCMSPDPVTGLPTSSGSTSPSGTGSTVCSATTGIDPDHSTGLPVAQSMENCRTLLGGFIEGLKLSDGTVVADSRKDLFTDYSFNGGNSSTCTFEKGANLCKHLFPYFPEKTVDGIDVSDAATGDGNFTMSEKQFWGANPATTSTNGKADDEASVMGLGMDTITWTYEDGDQIGVAVEGETSLTTDHASGNRIMWAFSNNTCRALEDLGSNSSRGFYGDDDTKKGIFTADVDLDDCLEENLLDPTGTSSAYEIKVDLASTPSDPMNDENGGGDRLSITASVQNVDLSSTSYVWTIERSKDDDKTPGDDTKWTDITQDVEKQSISAADMSGIGKNTIEMLLNLPRSVVDPDNKGLGVFWLRVKVKATENSGSGSQEGTATLNIKVIQQQNQIGMYKVNADSAGKLTLGGSDDSCGSGEMCYVANDQIIALKATNLANNGTSTASGFSWKVNDVAITCPSSSNCDDGTMFIPILGNPGEAVNVTATGTANGQIVSIIKKFIIIEPQTIIGAVETPGPDLTKVWPHLLGFYIDLDNNKYPDFSSQTYETYHGNTIKLKASTYSALNYDRTYTWTIDGTTQSSTSDTIEIPINKDVDDSYGVAVSASISSNETDAINNTRKALLTNWGIVADDFIDAATDDDIQVNVLQNYNATAMNTGKTGIFASLVTNLPEQLMFLLKITLTSFVLVFAMSLMFAVIPDSLFEKRKTDDF